MQFALEARETVLAEILQTTGLRAVPGIAAAGVAVDTIVTDVLAGQTVTVGVEGFNVFEQLHGSKRGT